MEENKKDIVSKLSILMKATRAGGDIHKMRLSEDESEVKILFQSGYERTINVECDSGIALIQDVIRSFL